MNDETPSSGAGPKAATPEPPDGEAGTDSLPGAGVNGPSPEQGQQESHPALITIGGTQPTPMPASPPASQPAGQPARRLQDQPPVNQGWWLAAIIILAVAALLSVLVALATGYSDAHRTAAALVALLDLAALATLAHVTLLWYQSGIVNDTEPGPGHSTLAFRRRGLKAAVMGEDGRASTSKTQVVIWTGAVVWALIDLLLLARAFPSGNLFTAAAGNNWRPEYLALLGLPVAAAAAAKAAVVSSNGDRGPQTGKPADVAARLQTPRVYVRNPVPDGKGMEGFTRGLAELITSDDGSVAWADLQYVTFTLITLVYFAVQLLTQPKNGLPPVPAALLTLMGVSAGAYTANKIVDTKGTVPPAATTPNTAEA